MPYIMLARSMLKWLLMLGIILAAVSAGSIWYVQHWFVTGDAPLAAQREAVAADNALFEVAPGSGIAAVAAELSAGGYLAHPRLWQLMARYRGEDRSIQAGEYRLQATQTPAQLLEQLVAGRVVERALVIVEGLTIWQMLAVVAAAPRLEQTLQQADALSLLGQLGLPEGHAEGQFFPDTYRYRAGDSDRDILRQAYERMQAHLADAWQGRDADLPYQNPRDLLIMASIVEKETGRAQDRGQISQVFTLRLRKGMRLQTDPTIIYGLGPTFDGDIKSADLVTDTPYNTYTRHGLPPTPIALPGEAALEAAAHPASGDYLYFVSKGDGTSAFSRTLAEHNAAVRQYQLRR